MTSRQHIQMASDSVHGTKKTTSSGSGSGRRPEVEKIGGTLAMQSVAEGRRCTTTSVGSERRRVISISGLSTPKYFRWPLAISLPEVSRLRGDFENDAKAKSCGSRGLNFRFRSSSSSRRAFPIMQSSLLFLILSLLAVGGGVDATFLTPSTATPAASVSAIAARTSRSPTGSSITKRVVQLNPCKAVIDERLVNLESLQNSNGTPRFVAGVTDNDADWSIAFNPCSSFNLPPDPHYGLGDQCHHVAICKYRSANTTSATSSAGAGKYFTVGIQRSARFHLSILPSTSSHQNDVKTAAAGSQNITSVLDRSPKLEADASGHVSVDDVISATTSPTLTSTTSAAAVDDEESRRRAELPVLVFRGIRSMKRWKVFIYLVCDHSQSGANGGSFTAINTGAAFEYHFSLRHRCCCPDACPEHNLILNSQLHIVNASSSAAGNSAAVLSVAESVSPPAVSPPPTTKPPPPRFLWLILVVNAGIFVVAVMVAALCCRRGGGGLMNSGPYTYIPAIHASRTTLTTTVERSVAANGSVASGLWTGQTVKRSASMSADYRDYSTAATQSSKLPQLDNCVIDIHSIDIGQRLGGGLFGDTYTCEWKDRTVAAKRITVGVHQSQLTAADYEWIISNITYLSKQRHQNLVAVLGVCIETRQPYVISEFIEGESLRDLMRRSLAEPFGWPQKIKMCIQVCDGMAFLHSAKTPILHRDLRSANILVDKNGKVKIVDFGLTKIIQRLRSECDRGKSCYCQKDTSATPASIRWTAPEILSNPTADDVTSPTVFVPACDVYSFAMVLWELATCTEPFEDISEESQVMQLILDGTRPSVDLIPRGTLPHIKELMKVCWDQNPESRPSFKQIALYLKNILQVLTKMTSSLRHRERSDSIISTTTSYLRSALNIAADT